MRRIVLLTVIIEACLIILPELTRKSAREENRPEKLLLKKTEFIGSGVRSSWISPDGVRQASGPEIASDAKASRSDSGAGLYHRHEFPSYVKTELLGYENRGTPSTQDALFFMPIFARFGIRLPVDEKHFIDAWNSGRLFDFNGKIYLIARDSGVGLVFRLN